MAIATAQIFRTRYQNKLLTLTIDQSNKATDIFMQMLVPVMGTGDIPKAYHILKKYLPNILRAKCFNRDNYPFHIEVKNTEIGHLFEHILLQYLCDQKTSEGIKNAVHNGITRWDWKRYGKGVFHINVDAGCKEKEILNIALNKSINLINNIIVEAHIQ
ncbi:MAG: hypothetical protein Q7K54_02590 [Candidatus Parcubacteria bacterium]|nr:hypothetical protein [Candidatus Parcubacteria bacterium]